MTEAYIPVGCRRPTYSGGGSGRSRGGSCAGGSNGGSLIGTCCGSMVGGRFTGGFGSVGGVGWYLGAPYRHHGEASFKAALKNTSLSILHSEDVRVCRVMLHKMMQNRF